MKQVVSSWRAVWLEFRQRRRFQKRLAVAKALPLFEVATHRKLDQIEAVGVAAFGQPLAGRVINGDQSQMESLVGNNAEVVALGLPLIVNVARAGVSDAVESSRFAVRVGRLNQRI